MNTTENQNDPYAHLKQALEDGRRIRVRRDHTDPWSKWCKKGDVTFHWNVPVDHYEIEPLPANKWAAEKAAHAQGKRIEMLISDDEYGPERWSFCELPDWHDRCEYRIAPDPDPAPAGKTDEQLGEIGKAAAKCTVHWSQINTAFAAAVREAVGKEQAEEIARLTAKSEEMCQAFVAEAAKKHEALAIIEQAIDMVNTPGTTKDNLPKAINAKIMQRAAAHDATLKKLDAAKAEIQRLKAEYASLLQAYKKLEVTEQRTRDAYDRAMTDCVTLREENNALTAELAKANAELERLRWRSVEVKPTREDADPEGFIEVMGKTDKRFLIPWYEVGLGKESLWRPFCPPPTPSAEEKSRTEFEAWIKQMFPGYALSKTDTGSYKDLNTRIAFAGWQAHASKEVK